MGILCSATVLKSNKGGAMQEIVTDIVHEITEGSPVGEVKPDVIKQFLEELPQKALGIGIRIVLAFLFFLLGVQIIKMIRKITRKSMQRAKADKGVMGFVDSFVKSVLYLLLLFLIAASLGVDAAGIVAVIGSVGVAIGLAVQGSLSNLAGGVLLLILRPFTVGDYIISESGHEGTVEEVQMFYTKLVTIDNRVVVLPNGNLSNHSLINVTVADMRRLDIPVSVSYDSDLRLAKTVLGRLLEKDEAVRQDREIRVFVSELADSCVRLNVRCWLDKEDYWEGKWRLTENIKYTLDEAGIAIPFPQLDVHLRKEKA
ncbi:MAG: mechanosensitive ion channel [Clostridium sp.]|nr:mechanosensitive ion channel [Clostridium sp.]